MKYISKLFGISCVALWVALIASPDVFAQTSPPTHYVDPENGSGTDCSIAEPCSLDRAVEQSNDNGDVILIRVLRKGGTADGIEPPSSVMDKKIRFGAYEEKADSVAGTLEFTGDFQIGASGQFEVNSLVTVQFEDVSCDAVQR